MRNNHAFFGIYRDKRWITVSNVLTASRIVLTPCVIMVIFLQLWAIAFALFLYAAATDFFDGYIARLLKDQTFLGKILDPIADKIFLVSSFGALVFLPSPLFPIPGWFLALILVREFVILIGSYMIMRTNESFMVAPTMWGKITTCFQLLFILWLFVCYFFNWSPIKTYHVSLVILSSIAIISLLQYVFIGFLYWLQTRS